MGKGEPVSVHTLLSDYSMKGKIKTIIKVWLAYLVILLVTRIPEVREAMQSFSDQMKVPWLESTVNFLLNGVVYVAIFFVIGTITTLIQKKQFNELRIYDNGICFCGTKENEELFREYENISLSHGKMQQSLWIATKDKKIKLRDYGWSAFSQSDVLRNNLERYGKWE